MFRFYCPWFALLLPLPFLLQKLFPAKTILNTDMPQLYFPSFKRLKKAFPHSDSLRIQSRFLFLTLLWLCWLSLVLALMQPEKIDNYVHVNNQGHDIMLAVDISASMQALDFSTASKRLSRLDATKEVVSKFAENRKGDRIGLITFGEHAYIHVPLTLDATAVSRTLNDTTTGMAGNATAIGDAIGLAVKTLRRRPEGSRVLVLLTDGEDNASSIPPLEAAKLAKQYGIKIYTIAVGKTGPVPYPLPHGGYSMVEVAVDEELLKKIAQTTEGQFFKATDKKALEAIYTNIDVLEKTESNAAAFLVRDPFYQYPLSLALILLLVLSVYELKSRRRVCGL